MMTPNPWVTVITPTYNRADFLTETIESVLGQDYPTIEYIILDDGSTDNTREVLETYSGRLIWESHPNMGETHTVNKGVGMARGEYVVIVNSDDPVLPGLIPETVAFLQSHPDVLVVYPDWNMIDYQGNILHEFRLPEYSYLDMLRLHWCQPGPGALIRRTAWELVGGRTSRFQYMADYDFWLRLGLHGQFGHIPQTLATWRWHSEGASTNHRGLLMAQEHVALLEGIYTRPDLSPEVLRVKAQALSSAYGAAAECCLPFFRKESCDYLLQGLRYDPLCPFIRPQRSLTYFIEIVFGAAIATGVRSLLRVVRHHPSTT